MCVRGHKRGLDNAGKTTIVKKIMGEDVNTVSPTLGFIIKTIDYDGYLSPFLPYLSRLAYVRPRGRNDPCAAVFGALADWMVHVPCIR